MEPTGDFGDLIDFTESPSIIEDLLMLRNGNGFLKNLSPSSPNSREFGGDGQTARRDQRPRLRIEIPPFGRVVTPQPASQISQYGHQPARGVPRRSSTPLSFIQEPSELRAPYKKGTPWLGRSHFTHSPCPISPDTADSIQRPKVPVAGRRATPGPQTRRCSSSIYDREPPSSTAYGEGPPRCPITNDNADYDPEAAAQLEAYRITYPEEPSNRISPIQSPRGTVWQIPPGGIPPPAISSRPVSWVAPWRRTSAEYRRFQEFLDTLPGHYSRKNSRASTNPPDRPQNSRIKRKAFFRRFRASLCRIFIAKPRKVLVDVANKISYFLFCLGQDLNDFIKRQQEKIEEEEAPYRTSYPPLRAGIDYEIDYESVDSFEPELSTRNHFPDVPYSDLEVPSPPLSARHAWEGSHPASEPFSGYIVDDFRGNVPPEHEAFFNQSPTFSLLSSPFETIPQSAQQHSLPHHRQATPASSFHSHSRTPFTYSSHLSSPLPHLTRAPQHFHQDLMVDLWQWCRENPETARVWIEEMSCGRSVGSAPQGYYRGVGSERRGARVFGGSRSEARSSPSRGRERLSSEGERIIGERMRRVFEEVMDRWEAAGQREDPQECEEGFF